MKEQKRFFDYLQVRLKNNTKTSWGKNELASFITSVWADFLYAECAKGDDER